jgi:hypothetical protein
VFPLRLSGAFFIRSACFGEGRSASLFQDLELARNSGKKLFVGKRLGEKVVRPRVKRPVDVFFVSQSGHGDDLDFLAPARVSEAFDQLIP